MNVLRLTRSEAHAAMLLPAVLGRIRGFLMEFEKGLDSAAVINSIWEDFGAGGKRWLILAYVTDEGEVKGHLLAGLVSHYYAVGCRIYQIHHDDDVGEAWESLIAAEQQVVAWAERTGCRAVEFYPASESRGRLFTKAGYRKTQSRYIKDVLGR